MTLTVGQLKELQKKFCQRCTEDCTSCKVIDFLEFAGIRINSGYSIRELMKTNMPVNITHTGGKYKQTNRRIFR